MAALLFAVRAESKGLRPDASGIRLLRFSSGFAAEVRAGFDALERRTVRTGGGEDFRGWKISCLDAEDFTAAGIGGFPGDHEVFAREAVWSTGRRKAYGHVNSP